MRFSTNGAKRFAPIALLAIVCCLRSLPAAELDEAKLARIAPAGGLCSTGPDIARFYRMMLNQGTLDGKRIRSPESVKTMTALQTGEIVCGFTPGAFGHGGAFGTQSWADPKQDLFLIMLIQRTGLPNGDASTVRQEFQKIAVGALK